MQRVQLVPPEKLANVGYYSTDNDLKKQSYNSLFGLVQITPPGNAGEDVGVRIQEGAVTNYVRRELGVTTRIDKLNKTIDALTDPRAYLQASANDLLLISDKAARRYQETYITAVKRGHPEEKCLELAKSASKSLYNDELKIHNDNFPEDVTDKIVKKLK